MASFDGETFDQELDGKRLTTQLARVFAVLRDQKWHLLSDFRATCPGSENGISARIRDFRKPRFGAYTVERRRVEGASGLWEYRLVIPERKESSKYQQEGLWA